METAVDPPKKIYPDLDIVITDEPIAPGSKTMIVETWIRCRLEGDGLSKDRYYLSHVKAMWCVPDNPEELALFTADVLKEFCSTIHTYLHASAINPFVMDLSKIDLNTGAMGAAVFRLDPNQESERERMIKREKDNL